MFEELVKELQKPEYQGLSDQEAADRINAKRVSVRRLVPTSLVKQHAIENAYWHLLVEAQSSTNAAIRATAISVMAWLDDVSGKMNMVDFDNPTATRLITALISAGLLTVEQAQSVNNLANKTIPWTESVELPEMGIGLVQNARRAE